MYGFGASFATGFMDRADELNTRRREIASKFNQYRKDNPYATAQDLEQAASSLIGTDFYLRPGNATQEALDAYGEQNAINRMIRDIDRGMQQTQNRDKLNTYVTDDIKNNYLLSGNMDAAIEMSRQKIYGNLPGDAVLKKEFDDIFSGLGNRKDALAQTFRSDLLDANLKNIESGVLSGQDPNTIMSNLPAPFATQEGRSMVEARIAEFQRDRNRKNIAELNQVLNDPSVMQQVAYGDMSILEQEFGNEFTDVMREYAVNRAESHRMDTWRGERQKYGSSSIEAANKALSDNVSRFTTAFGAYQNLDADNSEDFAKQVAISQIGSMVVNPAAYPIITSVLTDLDDETDPNTIVAEIINRAGPYIQSSDEFTKQYRDNYMSVFGVRGEKPQTLPEYYNANFAGDDGGAVGRLVSNLESTKQDILKPTAQLYSSIANSSYGLPSASAIEAHLATAMGLAQDHRNALEELENRRFALRDRTAFLPSYRATDASGQPIKEDSILSAADQQINQVQNTLNQSMSELDDRIKQLKQEQIFWNLAQKGKMKNSFISPEKETEFADAAIRIAKARGDKVVRRNYIEEIARIAGFERNSQEGREFFNRLAQNINSRKNP